MVQQRRTPKVFNSQYQPPKKFDWSAYQRLKPLLVLLVVVIAFYLVGRLPIFHIKEVTLSGDTSEAVVNELDALKGKSLFSRFVIETTERLEAANPSVKDLSCSRGIPSTLRCQLSLRQASIGWKKDGVIYLVDQSGYAFKEQGDTAVPLIVEDKGAQPVKAGQVVASREVVDVYLSLIKQLQERGYQLGTFSIAESLYQVNVAVTGNTSADWQWTPATPITLLMVTNYPLSAQIDAATQLLKTKSSAISERVDVRVPGYAYTR